MQIQELEAELRIERFLNHLNHQIYGAVAAHNQVSHSQHQHHEPIEAELFQIVVGELRALLGSGLVAIALPVQPLDDDLASPITMASSTFKISHLAPHTLHREALPSQLLSPALRLGSLITANQLQTMDHCPPPQRPAWQIAHPIADRQGVLGWLILVAPCSHTESWLLEHQTRLVQRVAEHCAIAIHRTRLLQVDCPHCQKLDAQNRQLLRANQLKSEFLANTSHEIRTPLSSILGFTHLLLEQGYNPSNLRHQEYLNIILSSGQHLLALINDILDLSKVEANQLELQWELVDVPELCRKVLALVKEKAHGKGLKLHLDLDPHATTFVADSLRLKQMLFNLLSNAIKFTPLGSVGLQVKQVGIFLHFTVWDTGIGITKEQQQQLFRPYSQIANSVVEATEGTGLGLALTQRLAELHNGCIEIVSESGQGSQFTLVLPLNPKASTDLPPRPDHLSSASPTKVTSVCLSTQDVPKRKPQQGLRHPGIGSPSQETPKLSPDTNGNSSTPMPAPSHCRVLLVEDNSMNATLITTVLMKAGCEVIWARESREMWQNLEVLVPDLILMDINLPEVDGLTLIRQLRTYKPYQTIPVIAQTAMAMLGDRELCLEAGANDYISKPINFAVLRQLVCQHTGTPLAC